eukprot:6087611-Pyramimonas_sp.AAC.1
MIVGAGGGAPPSTGGGCRPNAHSTGNDTSPTAVEATAPSPNALSQVAHSACAMPYLARL